MTRQHVVTDQAPAAIGPYSQAVWAGELIFMSGQTPLDPSTGRLVSGGVAEQTSQVFDNLEAVLGGAGLAMDHVIKCTVFLTTMDDFAAMNEVYATRFEDPFPSRSTVAVAALPLGARVEIELVDRRPGAEAPE
jgi:2-iminobutanoate/2-iminopropanoate deaminase